MFKKLALKIATIDTKLSYKRRNIKRTIKREMRRSNKDRMFSLLFHVVLTMLTGGIWLIYLLITWLIDIFGKKR